MIFEDYVNPYLFSNGSWVIFLILAAIFLCHLIVAIWVKIDASKRLNLNRRFWITVAALTGIFGLIAYLMKTRRSRTLTET
jgi:uncharacterized membrane protein HdeD (DUF308 family)